MACNIRQNIIQTAVERNLITAKLTIIDNEGLAQYNDNNDSVAREKYGVTAEGKPFIFTNLGTVELNEPYLTELQSVFSNTDLEITYDEAISQARNKILDDVRRFLPLSDFIKSFDGGKIQLNTYSVKNPHLLNKAVNKFKKKYPDVKIIIDSFEKELKFAVPQSVFNQFFNSSNFYQLNNENAKNLEPQIQELDNHLLDFLKSFGVESEQVDDLKERLGIDSLGAVDVLNKLIWYNKNRNSETIPEEAAHMITMLMGKDNPTIKELLQNIDSWSEYEQIKADYLPIYNNEEKVKIEAIGKLIAKALVKNYKAKGLNKTLLQKLLRSVSELLNKITSMFSANSSEFLADKIAINVLLGNKDFIYKVNETFFNQNKQLDYQKALENNEHAADIIKSFGEDLGNKLTGSLAIAGQLEEIYRPENEPIHDLDFVVDGTNRENLQKLDKKLEEYNAIPIHNGWKHEEKGYTTFAFYIPKKGYTVEAVRESKGWVNKIQVKNELGEVVSPTSENVIGVDFFVYTKDYKEKNTGIFTSWNDIYDGKLGLGSKGGEEILFSRPKDQRDFVLMNPKNRSVSSQPAFIYYNLNKNENVGLKQGVPELFESNPELANAVYEALEFKSKPDVILPIGTSGSGKSTFIKSLPQENLVVIEPDAMRVEFTGDINDKSKDKEIYVEAANRAIQAIKQGKQVVFDTTNLTKDKRLPFIEAIKKAIPNANIQYKLMELNPELAKQRIKAQLERGENRAAVSDETIDRHAASYKQMLEDIKSEPISNFELTPQQKQQAQQLYSQYLDSLNKPNTNPILQGNQQEQVKKFAELQERLNNKEFLEGAKRAYESTPALQQLGTQEEYNDYIARVSLGIIKNPSSGEYNYTSKVKDIVYHGTDVEFDDFDDKFIGKKDKGYFSKGFYFGKTFEGAKHIVFSYTNRQPKPSEIKAVILNLKNPLKIQSGDFSYTGSTLEGYDGAYEYSPAKYNDSGIDEIQNNIVVKSSSQIHILGSKQDIEGFKEFVSPSNITDPKLNILINKGFLDTEC